MEGVSKGTLAHAHVTGAILRAFFDVYRELGYGFSEVVYRRALGIVIRGSGLDAVRRFLSMCTSVKRRSAGSTPI